MKIKSLYVDGYKNLIQTQVNFTSSEVPTVIIGNNGTGKSNLIEALIQIFINLYYDTDPLFTYRIEYECNNKGVKINSTPRRETFTIEVDQQNISKSRFKNWIREIGRMPPFPDLIFCYYSGTCNRTKQFIERFDRSYNALLRNRTQDLERLFVFSDVEHGQFSLLGLFAHRHLELLTKLSLRDIQRFKITLIPPSTFSPESDDPSYWGTTGAIREFLADLDNAALESYNPSDSSPEQYLRSYIFDRGGLERVGAALDRKGTNFQSMMQGLVARKMVKDTSFELVNSNSGATYGINDLSEGEKQLLSVIGGLKLYNQPESLVLLDEPDTHLNPSWSWEYESLLKYALSDEQKERSMVLLATHDPVVISGMTKEQVLIADISQNQLRYTPPVRDPRGQGVANVLTSEFFGLPSSLDKNTQTLLDERLKLAFKKGRLSNSDRRRLSEINEKLKNLGLHISFRDPEYAAFEEERNQNE